jgi:radical S-adenosyl methionine domain-containing protein 2
LRASQASAMLRTRESNRAMAKSYLILDEYMRFLDKGDGIEKASKSILDVGVSQALSQIRWDQAEFDKRGGIYDWSRVRDIESCSSGGERLEW